MNLALTFHGNKIVTSSGIYGDLGDQLLWSRVRIPTGGILLLYVLSSNDECRDPSFSELCPLFQRFGIIFTMKGLVTGRSSVMGKVA